MLIQGMCSSVADAFWAYLGTCWMFFCNPFLLSQDSYHHRNCSWHLSPTFIIIVVIIIIIIIVVIIIIIIIIIIAIIIIIIIIM